MREIDFKEFMDDKPFMIEPSRRFCHKWFDIEQIKLFIRMQKDIDRLWRRMGVTSIEVVQTFPLIQSSDKRSVDE